MIRSRAIDLFRLTKGEYFADFFITPPLTLALLIVSLMSASWTWPIWFVVGVFAWTLYEYATHRWVSHRVGIFRDAHALHHQRQRDYIAIHPAATLLLYCAFWLAFGFNSSAIAVGFSVGYVAYSAMHTLFHYGSSRLLVAGRARHGVHHKWGVFNYGVTTGFWDRIFGTYRAAI